MQVPVALLPQPQMDDCWKPRTLKPDPAHDEDQTSIVNLRPLVRRLRFGDRDEEQSDEGDGDVDPEDGPPGPLGEVAAEDRPDGGQAAGDAEEQGQSPTPLVQVKCLDHDGQRGREHERAADALGESEYDDPGLRRPTGGSQTAKR